MTDGPTTSTLPQPLVKSFRDIVLCAMERMVPVLQAEIKRKNGSEVTSFFNFFDLEISVSDPLLSTNCPPLATNDMVVFVKFKEKMMLDNIPRTPRSVLIPICMTPTFHTFPFITARIWELYSPRWEHEDMITTDPATIIYLKAEVLKHMQTVAVETAQKALQERKTVEDAIVAEHKVAEETLE